MKHTFEDIEIELGDRANHGQTERNLTGEVRAVKADLQAVISSVPEKLQQSIQPQLSALTDEQDKMAKDAANEQERIKDRDYYYSLDPGQRNPYHVRCTYPQHNQCQYDFI